MTFPPLALPFILNTDLATSKHKFEKISWLY